MPSLLNQEVLVLNKNWTAINTCTVKKALTLVFKESATIVDEQSENVFQTYTWSNWAELRPKEGELHINSYHSKYKIPQIICLTNYKHSYETFKEVKLNRKNIYKRDGWTCSYCNKKFPITFLSVDHIIPKCRKGKNIWTNVTTACKKCNTKKADYLLSECNMVLSKKPEKPKWTPLFYKETPPKIWENFI